MIEPRIEFSYEYLRGEIKRGVSGPACMPHERGLLSAKEFDDFSRANEDVCEQIKKLDATMPASIKPPFRRLVELGFRPLTGDERYVKPELEMVNSSAALCEQDLTESD